VFWIRTSIPRFLAETTEMYFAVRIPARILFFPVGVLPLNYHRVKL